LKTAGNADLSHYRGGQDDESHQLHHRSGSTRIGFRGTALMPEARGEAKVQSEQGVIKIDAEMEKLGPATQFGRRVFDLCHVGHHSGRPRDERRRSAPQ
jgi:hypothetical protein